MVDGAKGRQGVALPASCLVSLRTSLYFRFARQKTKSKGSGNGNGNGNGKGKGKRSCRHKSEKRYKRQIFHGSCTHTPPQRTLTHDCQWAWHASGRWLAVSVWRHVCLFASRLNSSSRASSGKDFWIAASSQRKAQHKYAYQIFR